MVQTYSPSHSHSDLNHLETEQEKKHKEESDEEDHEEAQQQHQQQEIDKDKDNQQIIEKSPQNKSQKQNNKKEKQKSNTHTSIPSISITSPPISPVSSIPKASSTISTIPSIPAVPPHHISNANYPQKRNKLSKLLIPILIVLLALCLHYFLRYERLIIVYSESSSLIWVKEVLKNKESTLGVRQICYMNIDNDHHDDSIDCSKRHFGLQLLPRFFQDNRYLIIHSGNFARTPLGKTDNLYQQFFHDYYDPSSTIKITTSSSSSSTSTLLKSKIAVALINTTCSSMADHYPSINSLRCESERSLSFSKFIGRTCTGVPKGIPIYDVQNEKELIKYASNFLPVQSPTTQSNQYCEMITLRTEQQSAFSTVIFVSNQDGEKICKSSELGLLLRQDIPKLRIVEFISTNTNNSTNCIALQLRQLLMETEPSRCNPYPITLIVDSQDVYFALKLIKSIKSLNVAVKSTVIALQSIEPEQLKLANELQVHLFGIESFSDQMLCKKESIEFQSLLKAIETSLWDQRIPLLSGNKPQSILRYLFAGTSGAGKGTTLQIGSHYYGKNENQFNSCKGGDSHTLKLLEGQFDDKVYVYDSRGMPSISTNFVKYFQRVFDGKVPINQEMDWWWKEPTKTLLWSSSEVSWGRMNATAIVMKYTTDDKELELIRSFLLEVQKFTEPVLVVTHLESVPWSKLEQTKENFSQMTGMGKMVVFLKATGLPISKKLYLPPTPFCELMELLQSQASHNSF